MAGNTTQTHTYTWWSPDGINMVPVSTSNPLPVTVISGGGSNASVGLTGATAPTSATEIGIIDLSGNLEGVSASNPLPITGTISATTTAHATTAAPSYTNNTDDPLSMNLTGDLRVISKQSGTYTVGVDQSTPGTTNLVDASNFAVTQDQNAGAAGASTLRVVLATGGATPIPTGAATSALQTSVGATAHTDAVAITTALGTPFQAGGSIGNTTFAATQSGTWNIGTVTTLTGVTPAFGATAASIPASAGYEGLRGTTANPTAVTDGQLVGGMADKVGRQIIIPYACRDLVGQQTTTITASTSETTIVTAVSATFLDILSFNFTNSGASATLVSVRDDTAGTVRASFYVPAGDMRGQTYTLPFTQTAVNKNWTAQCGTSTSSLICTVQFVKNI